MFGVVRATAPVVTPGCVGPSHCLQCSVRSGCSIAVCAFVYCAHSLSRMLSFSMKPLES